MNEGVYLASTCAAANLCDNPNAPCYTMLCRDMRLLSNDPMSCTWHPSVTNPLQEFDDGMESRTTPIQEEEDDEDITTLDMYTLKSELSSSWSSFRFRIPEIVCTKNDATVTYGVHFRISLYGWKDNFITFPTPPDSGTYLFGVNSN